MHLQIEIIILEFYKIIFAYVYKRKKGEMGYAIALKA